MADQSDVETALVTLASAALYPNGTNASSVPGGGLPHLPRLAERSGTGQ